MDLIIFLTGAVSGAAFALWALPRLVAKYTERSEPTEDLSVLHEQPPRAAFPSLSEADLEAAIQRTYEDERRTEMYGYRHAAQKHRDDRAAYERELANRRRKAAV